jgi:hypothetical protein
MDVKEFEKRRNSIWAKYERELGCPIVQSVRDRTEADIVRLSSSISETLADLEGFLRDNILIWKALVGKGDAQNSGDSVGVKPQRKYRKSFERRFYLVNFVMDHPFRKGSRIDWERMATAWNTAHLSDQMRPDSLRVEYYRAIKEDVLMLQVHISRGKVLLAKPGQLLDQGLRNMAAKNPLIFAVASLVGQKMWTDTQPLILALRDSIKNSPMYKELESQNPEQAASLESQLEAIVNMGDLNPVIKELASDSSLFQHKQRRKTA